MKRRTVGSEESSSAIAVARLVPLLPLVLAALFCPFTARAQQIIHDDHDPNSGFCEQDLQIVAELKTTGAYLPGATIGIRAEPLLIRVQQPGSSNPHVCGVGSRPVPTGKWSWQIIGRPMFSTSQLSGNGRNVTLLLDRAGVYRIQLTVCASGCEITLADQTKVTVGPETREVVVRVVTILPPEKSPVLQPDALRSATPTAVDNHCGLFSDKLDAAWYTVLPWNGPSDYKLLEGEVVRSSVAQADNGLNHNSQDWTMDVIPDPWHRGLLRSGQDQVEVEWERVELPERYRPTEKDRISAIGYWIYDCGHGAKTEIHPPTLLAVHRARAIRLPESAGFGANAFVPGIITDIWVNREAGDTTNGCHATGLHQQVHPTKPLFDAQGRPISRCLPDSEGFSSNPLGIFEFNIYLPRSPQAVMAAIGRTAPPVPLFCEVSGSAPNQQLPCSASGTGQNEPRIEQTTVGDVTYLKVTIDLRNYSSPKYSRRIVAAWGHAAPDNWGARRWNVRVTSLDITDDADGLTRGDGDWRFWINMNSAAMTELVSEWTKVFDCDDCAHGVENLSIAPASVVLFPNQTIWIATSGFEDDWTWEDSIAPLHFSVPQARIENASVIASDGAGKYKMFYQVLAGPDIGPAVLTPAAQASYNAYRLINNDLHGVGSTALAVLNASFSTETGNAVRPGVRPAEERESEPLSVEEMSVQQFRQFIQRAQREQPAQLDTFFRELGRLIEKGKKAGRGEEVRQFLKTVKPTIPAVLWTKHGLEAQLRAVSKPR